MSEAAERWNFHAYCSKELSDTSGRKASPYWTERGHNDSLQRSDAFALANLAASLLDAEIASGEWLNAQGIGQTFDCEGGICWQEESGDICINFVEDSDYIRLLKNPTRGAVRALQLALSPKEDGNG